MDKLELAGCRSLRCDDTDHSSNIDLFVCTGFPKDTRSTIVKQNRSGGDVSVSQYWPLLPLSPVADNYKDEQRSQIFRASIIGGMSTNTENPIVMLRTNGMSGGPILAIKIFDQGCSVRLVATQVAEREETKQISGYFVKPMLPILILWTRLWNESTFSGPSWQPQNPRVMS